MCRCGSARAAGIYFQACSFNHSDISPSLESTTCERFERIIAHVADSCVARRTPLHSTVLMCAMKSVVEIVSDLPLSRDHFQRFR
jgi:hypothetical protein